MYFKKVFQLYICFLIISSTLANEHVYKIKGIGFKKGAWAEYKVEGYGVRYYGNVEEEKIGKILVELISLTIKGKEYIGIEIDHKESAPFEKSIFAQLFEKDNKNSYYLAKINRSPTICMSQPPPYYEDVPELFDKKSIEQEYEVDLTIWKFIGKENLRLNSGKNIEVFKFRMVGMLQGAKITRDLWLSSEIPTYMVLNKETIGDKSRSITLVNFGMEGGLPLFTDKDVNACNAEVSDFSQLHPNIQPEVSKKFCQHDMDCVCGVDKETGKCAFGNRNFIDTSKQCPDFCSGIGGQFEIKCINNICTQRLRR
jgi:hypothetical protein